MQNNKNHQWLTQDELTNLYLHVCQLDMQALKPGNVGLHANSNELSVENFVQSAEASAEPLMQAGLSLGERIYAAVKATHEAVGTNTNLGIILLIAPLAQVCLDSKKSSQSIQNALSGVLQSTTIDDAKQVYNCLLYTSPSPRDLSTSRMPSSA